MSRARATATGCLAVLMWSGLALLTVRTAPVPPLLLNALCFAVGGAAGLALAVGGGRTGALGQVPWRAYAFGTGGLFAYHLLYFSALRLAPAAEAGLVAYLWPLLIVILSGLLPGERLGRRHIAGAALAFAGVAALLLGGAGGTADSPSPGPVLGLTLAALAAVVWAGYSVGSRRLGAVPTDAVAVCCLAAAALSALAHLAVEEAAWPVGPAGWGAVLLLGLGPLGLAFLAWDVGMKRGDIQLLAVLAYAAPPLSTLALVVAGEAEPSIALALATALIVAGAALAGSAARA